MSSQNAKCLVDLVNLPLPSFSSDLLCAVVAENSSFCCCRCLAFGDGNPQICAGGVKNELFNGKVSCYSACDFE